MNARELRQKNDQALRQELLECGIQVVDTPEGTRWKRLH